jgi:multidrug efflux system membrane fusion protein
VNLKRVLLIAIVAGVAAFVWFRTHGSSGKRDAHAQMPRSTAVAMTQARVASAPVQFSALGQVISPHSVSVKPQVSGTLAEVFFREGQNVKAGDSLFRIDAAPYQAAVAQARAQRARDQAALESARSQYERLAPLAKKEFVTPQELENARAAAAQAQALVEADEAAIKTAQIDLDRTLVRAPIAGRTGALAVTAGNVVGPSDAMPVVVINQLQPIQVEFSIEQAGLARVRDALREGTVPVNVTAEQNGESLGEGKLVFVDNAVDAATGTVKLRAEIDNREERLWPGAFVNATVTLAVQQDAVLLPETAMQSGAEGPFVFLVGADGKVTLRSVVVDRQVGGDLVIGSGLKGGETVVARAPRNLAAGDTVSDAATSEAAAPAGERRKRGKP